jgi:hypothetical protein
MTCCPSLIPIVVVTVLSIFLGMLWYSPLFAGNMWVKAYKLDTKKLKPSAKHYVGNMLLTFVTAFILAIFIDQFQILDWQSALVFALFLWVGFIATTHFCGVIWANKPLVVYFIDVTYYLVSIVMMSVLLAIWL